MRSLLFVPGDDEEKLGKSLACGADAIIVDLEDSVAAAAKPEARVRARAFLGRARALERRPKLIVRVNPLPGGEIDRDLEAVMPGAPDAILLPKSLGGASVQELSVKLGVREALEGLPDGATGILAIATETAEALFAMASYRGASARLMGLAWGAEDLSADLGAETNRDDLGGYASPYRLARDLTLFGATAAGVAPIDTIYANFRDLDGLHAEAEAAQRDGFAGKMAIHPAQVAVINAAFTPTTEAVGRARAVVAAFAANPGAGVVVLDGAMLDLPHLTRARKVLRRAGES